jgi:hypothetical protein
VSPYAFAYDLPLLIPALLWLSRRWSTRMTVIWSILAGIAAFAGFSGFSYFATLLVSGLIVLKLVVLPREQPSTDNAV